MQKGLSLKSKSEWQYSVDPDETARYVSSELTLFAKVYEWKS